MGRACRDPAMCWGRERSQRFLGESKQSRGKARRQFGVVAWWMRAMNTEPQQCPGTEKHKQHRHKHKTRQHTRHTTCTTTTTEIITAAEQQTQNSKGSSSNQPNTSAIMLLYS
jgi:hypothetical protein